MAISQAQNSLAVKRGFFKKGNSKIIFFPLNYVHHKHDH